MNADAVARYQKDALTGHRPTWKMGANTSSKKGKGSPEADLEGAADPFSMFSELNGRGRWRPGPGSGIGDEPKPETRKIFNAERKALQAIRRRWEAVGSKLDGRGRGMVGAGEALGAGGGGLEAVSEITGLARSTIGRGKKELDAAPLPKGRARRDGAGRPDLSSRDATLVEDLLGVIEPVTLGDPVRPMLWVSKSHQKLADALQKKGHEASASSLKSLLPPLRYTRQSNRKADEGSKHPDRNAQFEHINAKAIAAQAAGQPVISVDTKKKELIGNYKNGGTDYRPKGDPQRVKVHDFEDKELGKVVPYGVYDVGANAGWVSVGINGDTAQFAVASIRRWLGVMGRERYPDARELTITADGGGSNGSRVRLWKVELQKFADTTGLVLHVHR